MNLQDQLSDRHREAMRQEQVRLMRQLLRLTVRIAQREPFEKCSRYRTVVPIFQIEIQSLLVK